MDTIVVAAFLDGQPTQECNFTATVNGTNQAIAPNISGTGSPIPGSGVITLNVGDSLALSAHPTSGQHWDVSGTFQLQGIGQLAPVNNPPAEFAPPFVVASATDSLILLAVHLSRLRDITARALTTLATVPSIRTIDVPSIWPPPPSVANTPPPWITSWDCPELDGLNYINNPAVTGQSLQIINENKTPAATNVVLQLFGDPAQQGEGGQAIAVSWPDAVPRSDSTGATPFLLYFHPSAGQNVINGYYVNPQIPGAYPFNFDYIFYGLWAFMNYGGAQNLTQDPLTGDHFKKGLPYQMEAAGKYAVIVLPCNRVGPGSDGSPGEIGRFQSAASAQEILLDIQRFMFRRAVPGVYNTPGLGRTALAAFSSGVGMMTNFLSNRDNQAHPFYQYTLGELYMFDGGNAARVAAWIGQAIKWANTDPSKVIRAYSQVPEPGSMARLISPASVPGGTPWLVTTGMRTAALLPATGWNSAATAAGGSNVATGTGAFDDTHQLIPAMMLTDALRSSSF